MLAHGQGRQGGGSVARMHLLAGCGLVALLLAGCASGEGPMGGISEEALAPAAGSAESAGVPVAASSPGAGETARSVAGQARAAPVLTGRVKPPEPAYPTFGAPAQVGDRPVLTKEQSAAMQKNLEGLASDREKTMLRQIEADQ